MQSLGNKVALGKPIALFTDFGSTDIYVGQLHALAQSWGVTERIIDFFHDVKAFDIAAGASLLAAMADYLPRDIIVVGVVDPGVGSMRASIGVKIGGRWFIGPDNGLFSRSVAWSKHQPVYWSIESTNSVSMTFHGRDVFLPVAIQLSKGNSESLRYIKDATNLTTSKLADGVNHDDLRIIHVDHYGNLISGLRGRNISEDKTLSLCDVTIHNANYYECVSKSECFWYVNSIGLVEIAANQDSAARLLGGTVGNLLSVSLTL